ncbi:TRAP transporter small permease [Neobacillus mesonae]|uniref:TRAP transporter small permease n=1 Tax=Neobacillus mesonae TaxID=1193713 RepID=UPI00203FD36F|nr:TRAP transporter small permease [Neobacillus mesonae]MCM3567594.1 TRAP transporter small permease [Neobacillus mesonae]
MKRLYKFFTSVETIFSSVFIIGGLGLIIYGVFMRYIMHDGQSWIDEVSKYVIIWGAFIAFSVALRDGYHIRIEFIYDKLSNKGKRVLDGIGSIVGLIFSCSLAYYGWQLVSFQITSQQRSIDAGLPMWLVFSIIPVSGLFLTIRFLLLLVKTIKGEISQSGSDLELQRVLAESQKEVKSI